MSIALYRWRSLIIAVVLSALALVTTGGMLHAEVGVVHYMSVSGSGVGRMGRLDAIVKPGTGNHRVTGISERQKESFSYALTWVDYQLARCRPPRSLKSLDVHVYFDNMAVPKDGPSASVAMGLAVLSAATGASILPGVAITGEITPRGGIAPVGGVFQKVTAALKGGATTIIVPRENAKDVPQPSDAHAENVLMIATDSMDVALSYAMGESSAWDERYRSRAALLTEFLVALAQGQFDVAEQKSIQMRARFPEDLWFPVTTRKRTVRARVDHALERAKELTAKGDLVGAQSQLVEVSRRVGENAEVIEALQKVKTLMGRPDYDVGKRALEGGDLDTAHKAFTRAVQTAPHEAAYQSALKQATNTLAEAQYTAGMRHLEQREYANAYRCLKRASELAPDNAECQKEMLRARVLAGNEAVAANPDGADAHRKLAAALRASGQKAEAVDEYRLAIRQQPDDGDLRHELVSLLLELNQLGPAAEALREELAVRTGAARRQAAAELGGNAIPGDAAGWFTRVRALLRSGNAAAAVAAAKEGLARYPHAMPLHRALAHALIAQGRNSEAVSEFAVVPPGGPSADWVMDSACLSAQHGNIEKARRQLADMIRRVSDTAGLRALRSHFSTRPAGSDQAFSGLPDGDLLRFLLMARYKAFAGDLTTANALAMICLKRDPLWHPVYTTLATILLLDNKPQPALVAVEFALALSPNNRWAKSLEALCLSASGSHDTALQRFNEIPIAAGMQAHLSYTAAYLYENMGLPDRAEREAPSFRPLQAVGINIAARKTLPNVLAALSRYEDDLMPPLITDW